MSHPGSICPARWAGLLGIALCAGAAQAQPVTREDWHPPMPAGYVTELVSVAATTFWAISPDGTTVYGCNTPVANSVFTQDQVSECFNVRFGTIGALPKPSGQAVWGWPRSACADGGIIVGGSLFSWDAASGPVMRPTIWYTVGFGFLLSLPPNSTGAGLASDISWDSSVVVGSCWRTSPGGNYLEPIRWVNQSPVVLSRGSRPEDTSGMVVALSGNGQRAVGILGQVDAAGHWTRWHSVIWDTFAPGPVDLTFSPPLPGGCAVGLTAGGADARVSYDGSVIVFKSAACTDAGGAGITPGPVVRWASGAGTMLTGMNEFAGMSSDGLVVVGSSGGDACSTSVGRLWEPLHGVRDLRAAIMADYGSDPIGAPPSATFMIPRGISADGRTIIGIAQQNCAAPASTANATSSAIIRLPSSPCPVPTITTSPLAASACWRGSATLTVAATGATSYQWRRNFSPLSDVPGQITGSTSPMLNISLATNADAGQYDCVASNACGGAASRAVALTVCAANFNCDASVNVSDIFAFLAAWFANSPSADINGFGGVTVADIFAFLTAWFAGC